MAEDPHTELVYEPFAEAAGEACSEPGGGSRETNGTEVGEGHREQHAAVAGQDATVDADLCEEGADVEQADLGQHQEKGHYESAGVRCQEGPEAERTSIPVAMRELDHGLRVFRFVPEDIGDPATELFGNLGIGQSSLGVGLERRRPGEESVSTTHQAPTSRSAIWATIAL